MDLVSHVLKAHGGRDRWRSKTAFSAHISISGALLPPPENRSLSSATACRPTLREVVIEGETKSPRLTVFGSGDTNRYGLYAPDRVELHSMAHQLLEALDNPIDALADRSSDRPLRATERTFLYGAAVWNAIAGPFLLDDARILAKEAQQLEIELPAAIDPLTPRRTLYVGNDGFVTRQVYHLKHLHPGPLVDTASAYIAFDGIMVPTLRRLRPLATAADLHSPPLLDIEIFDLRFS